MGLVYFISDGEYIKIGQTTSLQSRLANLQCANARQLTVLHTIDCADAGFTSTLESRLHSHFHKYRVMGEWFNLTWDVARLEVEALQISLADEIEKYHAEREVSRAWWKQRMLQSRFDSLVEQDIEENYPPMKKFARPQPDEKPYISRFADIDFKTFGQQEKENRFGRNIKEDVLDKPRERRFRFG